MTDNGPTTTQLDGRINKMVPAFQDHTKRIQKLERAYAVHINANLQEYTEQVEKMDRLIANIDTAPSAKQLCTVELAELRDKIVGVEEQLEGLEAELYMNVTAELNDDNKPAYTNEAQRKAALQLAKRHGDEYQEIKSQLDKLNLDKARLCAQLEEIEDGYKKDMAIFRGCVARVENVTARISL